MAYPRAHVPDRLLPDDAAEARWRARFTAARISAPDWARDAPEANIYVSNASGTWEVYAWNRATGLHRKVTERPNGTLIATVPPDGAAIWWFDDTDGDEFGRWIAEPFPERSPGQAGPAAPGVPDGYPAGADLGSGLAALGTCSDEGTSLYLHSGDRGRRFYASTEDASVAALSRDERLVAIEHAEHGDSRHPALRVYATSGAGGGDAGGTSSGAGGGDAGGTSSGAGGEGALPVAGEKWDGPGIGLEAVEFSPVAGDDRLLVSHERRGRDELLLWHIGADSESELVMDLPGDIVATWYPDATALLVVHFYAGRSSLYRYDLATASLAALQTPPGRIGGAGVRPDGTVEYAWSSAEHPPAIRARTPEGADDVLLRPPGPRAPESAPLTDAWVPGPAGDIHALYCRPAAPASAAGDPTVFLLHGGPHAADEDRFSAYRATWLDAGFAVVEVNYRGSTGYGTAWRDAIEGRPGLTELEDVAAVHDWMTAKGISDPQRCVVAGASWGGYLTLLALGTQPQRWAAGVASVPVADYVTAYHDEMEQLRSFDRALFGGGPAEVPEVYRAASPLTYVDAVRAGVLVLAGDNDPRCPIRQIENYLDRLAERGVPFEFYRYDAGHGSLVVSEMLDQVAAEVHFARRAVGLA